MPRMSSPRQRRGLALVALAVVGAVAVFVAVGSHVASVDAELGPRATVLVLAHDVAAFTPVTAADVAAVQVPRMYLPDTAVSDVADLAGAVAGVTLRRGSYLQSDSLVAAPDIGPGQRAVSLLLLPDTAVAGALAPYAVVDVVATYAKNDQSPAYAVVAVSSARVLSVGLPAKDTGAQLVTFAVAQPDAVRLALAAASASSVRLTLLSPPGAEPPADRTRRVTVP